MPHLATTSAVRRRLSDPAVERACAGIAPAWPLDRAIAVNPAHGLTDRRFEVVAADLAATDGVRWLPPRATLRQLWRAGAFQREHVVAALVEEQAAEPADATARADALLTALHEEPPPQARLPLLTDFADAHRQDVGAAPWSTRVLEQIARFAASWFDRGQAAWSPNRRPGLFNGWRARLGQERRPPTRMGRKALRAWLDRLPEDPRAAIDQLVDRLGLDAATIERVDYLGALLGSIRGWARWCAHERWQARLRGGDDDALVELLAVRIAWEALLVDDLGMQDLLPRFRRQLQAHPDRQCDAYEAQRDDRLLLRAAELGFQGDLAAKFAGAAGARPTTATAAAAVFCIDVRSERMRRALERASGGAVATHGFAGFFGLPIAHTPLGAVEARPQLPGLFAPALESGEQGPDAASTEDAAAARQRRLAWRRRWTGFRSGPGSAFAYVETFGLLSLGALAGEAFAAPKPARSEHVALTAHERALLQPCWLGDAARSVERRADLAAAALRGMGLARDLPPLVLLVGHGSSNRNNAQAAALDCGACGGHSGRDNARLLARTLMEPEVRAALAQRGLAIPAATRFVAALHDTTTDEVELAVAADADRADPAIAQLQQWLRHAGDAVRAERAPGLGLQRLAPRADELLAALRRRASDWAQVRPEWGLAGNAALVFAPRSRTQALDLDGRAFLHDYHAADDADGSLLAQLFLAPMQVATWINLQYYASVVDPRAFGSGSKLLHDVVGGRLGVCEGNGGDLRVGLPLQSVHDGRRWRHAPLRLSVYVDADERRVEAALATADAGRRLVENGWIHLLRLDADGSVWQRLRAGGWRRQPASTAPAVVERHDDRTPAPPRSVVETFRMHGMLLTMLALGAAALLRAQYVG
jgi:uncharacterized protein YbcC (UPF0753/DUF2309 family)